MKFGTLRITTADGRQREYPLDLPSIVIGRADGNAIVIDDLSVARRHARAFIDSSRLMLEDLGSAEGTYIDGVRITPNTPSLVEPTSEIRFGAVVARYEAPVEVEEPELEALPAVTPLVPPVAGGIGLKLAVGNEPLIPGSGGLTTEIIIHNRGNVVDEFELVVTGLPSTWLVLGTPRVGLLPGAETTVPLLIQPPRRSEAIAGDHPFEVTVTSETTGRSATETGNLRILGFNGLVLTVEPPRGRRDFVLVAGNEGNVTETLALAGVDDEDAFDYTFGQDVLEVGPGREQRMPFRVKPKKRALFGRETIVPFNVMARQEGGEAEAIPAAGQLVVHPPLEPLKRPILFSLVLIVLGIATFGVFLFSNDTGTKAASPEAAYAGVHMCDKGNQPKSAAAPASNANKASASLGTTSNAIPAVAQTGPIIQQQQGDSGGPYFAQNDPRWANTEYAKAGDPEFGPDWCGTTIAQCGCAMTSVTTMMALFNIVTMPDGQDLTPKTVNDWFNLNARKTARGWVSQGYIYGDVIWTAANQLSGEIAAKYPGTRTVRFARTGTGSDAEIKAELRAGRPVVLEVPGHWIAAVGLDGDTILINDPFYRDRKTLDAYAGKVKSSVLFEPSEDLSAVVITVPADTRIRVTDKQGRVVGTLDTASPEDAAKNAKSEIPGASYTTRQAWRDPTCVESAPPAGAGTNQIVLPGSKDDYKIEVLETTGGPTSVSIHTYDKNGQPTVQTIDNSTGGVTASVSFDPNSGKADVNIVGGKPVEEDSSARTAGKTTQAQTAASPSPSPSPSVTASPSATATAPGGLTTTTLSVSVPAGAKEVAVGTQNGFSVGDLIRISPGQANEEDGTITAFGSFILATPLKFGHSAGEPVVRLGGAPPGTGGTGGTGGGSQGPPKTELSPPDSVGLNCSVVYSDSPKSATLVCSAVIGGVFTTTRWTVDGSVRAEISGKTVFLATYTQDGLTSISVSACNQTLCKSDSTTQTIRFPVAPGAPTPTATPPPATPVVPTVTPPAVGAALNCGYLIDTTTVAGGEAQVKCLAQTKESLTSFTFQTTDLTPASTTLVSASSTDPTGARTYQFNGTAAPNDLTPTNQQATVTVGGKACTLTSCSTVSPAVLTIPYASVSLSVLPASVPLGTSVNLFAVITGPNGLVPAGGTVQFAAIDTSGATPVVVPIGLEVKVSPVGGFAVANLTVPTGQMPLSNTQAYKIIAVYSGGANMFGGTSPQQTLTVTPRLPDICNGFDDNGNGQIDESCLVLGDSGVSDKDIGAAVILRSVAMASGQALSGSGTSSIVVSPGANLTVTGSVLLNTAQPETCIDCVRQVYFGVGENTAVFPRVAPIGPYCAMSQKLPDPAVNPVPVALPQSGHNFTIKAPTVPGIYYLRSTASIQANCGNPPVGGPDVSVGRIIVQAVTTTTLDPLAPNVQLGNEFSLNATVNTGRPAGGISDPEGMLTGYVVFCDADMPSENGTTNPWCGANYKLGMVQVVSATGTGQKPSGVAHLVIDSGTYYQLAAPSLFQDPKWRNPLGNHRITASYLAFPDGLSAGRFTPTYGTPTFTGSDSTQRAFTLDPARTDIGIDVNPVTVPLGGTVNLVAALSSPPQFGPLNGSVSFMAGTTQLACKTTNTSGLELARVAYDTADIYTKFPTAALGVFHVTANYRPGIDCAGAPDGVSNYASVGTTPATSCSPAQPGCLTVTAAASKATLTLTPAGTTSLGNSAFAASVALVALPSNGTPFGAFTGKIQLTCDGSDIGNQIDLTTTQPFATDWANVANVCGAPLAGQHVFGARYIPDSSSFYAASTAADVAYSFTAVATTTTVNIPGGSATSALGGSITITATIAPQAGTGDEPFGSLTGTVQFLVGTTVIGTGSTSHNNGTGTTATCQCDTGLIYNADPTPVGTQTVTARYVSTDANYLGSTSATGATLTITPETTTLNTTVSVGAVPLGAPLTINAAVSALRYFGPMSGDVRFFDGTTQDAAHLLGSAAVSQLGNNPAAVASLTLDTARLYDSGSPNGGIGSRVITTCYVPVDNTGTPDPCDTSPGGNYAEAADPTGATVSLTGAPTTVALTAAPPAGNAGTSITLTAQVSPTSFGNFTGAITFKEGATVLNGGNAVNVSATGQATLTLSNVTAGTHTYTATYGGGGAYAASTQDGTVVVPVLWPTTTSITVPSTPPTAGTGVTVTLSTIVSCPQCNPAATPSGTVEFFDGNTSLGQATLASGSAAITIPTTDPGNGSPWLPIGQHPALAVRYYGGPNPTPTFAPSDSTLASLTVLAPTTTQIRASSATANPGSGSTLTVSITSPYSAVDIAGTVEITDSTSPGSPRWTVAVTKNGSNFEAVQVYTPPTSDVLGDRTFTAKFVPANGSLFATSTTATGVAVKVQHRTQVNLSVSPTTITWGQSSTLTATLQDTDASAPIPNAGSIEFYESVGGTGPKNTINTGTTDGTGVATYVYSPPGAQNEAVSAKFVPITGSNYVGSAETAQTTIIVNKVQTTTSINASATNVIFGTTVTISGRVTTNPGGTGVITGTVQIWDGGTQIGSSVLDASGNYSYSTATLAIQNHASHVIVAKYRNGGNYADSDSTNVGVTVNEITTSITFGAVTYDASKKATFTITVNPGSTGGGSLDGTITLVDDQSPHKIDATGGQSLTVPAGGSVSFTSNPLTAGTTYVVTVSYTPSAGSNFSGTSTTITLTP